MADIEIQKMSFSAIWPKGTSGEIQLNCRDYQILEFDRRLTAPVIDLGIFNEKGIGWRIIFRQEQLSIVLQDRSTNPNVFAFSQQKNFRFNITTAMFTTIDIAAEELLRMIGANDHELATKLIAILKLVDRVWIEQLISNNQETTPNINS